MKQGWNYRIRTLTFIPKRPATRLRGMKKKAKWVSFDTTSAPRIARSLSTMIILDMRNWKVLSIPRVVLSSFFLSADLLVVLLVAAELDSCQEFAVFLVARISYRRLNAAVWWNSVFHHLPNYSLHTGMKFWRMSFSWRASSILSRVWLHPTQNARQVFIHQLCDNHLDKIPWVLGGIVAVVPLQHRNKSFCRLFLVIFTQKTRNFIDFHFFPFNS